MPDDAFGLLDQALSGGRLRRGQTGGESDQMKGGGVLDPGSKAGRRLRLQGYVVGRDHPAGMDPDQIHSHLRDAGLVPQTASVDDAIETYTKLARVADQEGSKSHQKRMARAEAAHAAETYVAPGHINQAQFKAPDPHGRPTAERMGLEF